MKQVMGAGKYFGNWLLVGERGDQTLIRLGMGREDIRFYCSIGEKPKTDGECYKFADGLFAYDFVFIDEPKDGQIRDKMFEAGGAFSFDVSTKQFNFPRFMTDEGDIQISD